jgi:hypothetical protein
MPYDRLIAGFLAHADAVIHNYQDANFWAYRSLEELIIQDPEGAWTIITRIIHNVHDVETLDYVAASVLEDLICQHPYILIERIEALARADAHFKKALSNVWGWSVLPADIKARLDALVKN